MKAKEATVSIDEELAGVKNMWDGYNNQLRNTKAALDAKMNGTVAKTHAFLERPRGLYQ